MIDERYLKEIRELQKTGYWQALLVYLEEEIKKMKDISTIQGTAEEVGKEVMARQRAEKIIRKIMGEISPQKKISKNNYV